ncbi:MAG: TerB N-terminal domain-containing protein [Lachnospiraceae bacterium]|nr:TerB N-terminal domain-containing protein [Ruminococcus sp.]MCM1274972.1 TerB N-terminal domain-containing protein [Lachnospiraceae bacterium]
MSDEFKKFIDTGGKTLDEIRKTIEKMLNNTVDSVIDEAAKFVAEELKTRLGQPKTPDGYYKPEKIPPRSARPQSPPVRTAYPREHVSEHISPQDELMLDKIREMRDLEEVSENSYITKRCTEITFVRQGLFMSDVEDDFNRRVFCALGQPAYMAMSNSQLRTYFTWRTDVRRGKYPEVDKPYVLLYCYELLNKIGVSSAAEAFGKLLELWEGCKPFARYLDDIMPRWLKDFYVYNDVTALYPDVSQYLGSPGSSLPSRCAEELENGDYSGKLDYLSENSAYNIKGSIFLSDKTRPLVEGACEAALRSLSEYFSERGTDLAELLCGKVRKDYSWAPFRGAVVDLERTDGFRPLRISAAERYCIKRGEPSLEVFDFSPSRGFIGYLLKSVEAELRRQVKFKRYITPNIAMLENDFRNREKLVAAVTDERFEKLIPAAVAEYCRKNGISAPEKPSRKPAVNSAERSEYVRECVEIDVSKLSRIREQSDELAKRLIVDEETGGSGLPDENGAPCEDDIEEMTAAIACDDFSERVADCSELSPDEGEPALPVERNAAFSGLPDEWQSFANDLTPTHLAVLKRLRDGGAAEYCRQNGLLPETVCEEINTAALETILDVVIEGGEILPDYSAEIGGIIDAAGIG